MQDFYLDLQYHRLCLMVLFQTMSLVWHCTFAMLFRNIRLEGSLIAARVVLPLSSSGTSKVIKKIVWKNSFLVFLVSKYRALRQFYIQSATFAIA